ncbi:MAG: hypothetical protein KatS3mg011_2295 [Acidimicrobiia bacterium]|nr:MAG: hypothetical protein KatS3mg011_2295 [Acidimicrobiia bacterium]
MVLGLFDQARMIDARRAAFRENRLFFPVTYGETEGVHDYEIALSVLAARSSQLARLVTHRFSLAEVADAFALADDKRRGVLRVVVTP